MSPAEKLDLKMTAEQFAVWEREQTERHEFYQGEVKSSSFPSPMR
jgi:hypothetical protein